MTRGVARGSLRVLTAKFASPLAKFFHAGPSGAAITEASEVITRPVVQSVDAFEAR